MNTIETFTNKTLGDVRVVKNGSGEWFVAKDVCNILEIGNPTQALTRLDDDEKMTLISNESHSGQRGGAQMMAVVNEYGLWQLVLGSRKPQAKEFKRWLTHEVIPAIRKNGGYIDGQEYVPAEEKAKLEDEVRTLHQMAKDYQYQTTRLQEKVDTLSRIIEKDTTGDFDRAKKNRRHDESDGYDFDFDDYDEDVQIDTELLNISEYFLFEEMKSIVTSAKATYIDKAAANYLIGEINRLFVERNAN